MSVSKSKVNLFEQRNRKSRKIHDKSLIDQINFSTQNIIKLIFLGFSGIIFIYQIFSLYVQYKRHKIKIEKTVVPFSVIRTPHLTFCFKLVAVLNITKIFNQAPEILTKVENISRVSKGSRSYHEILYANSEFVYERFSTKQLINSVVSIPDLIRPCGIRESKNMTIKLCSSASWTKKIFSKNLCLTRHFNDHFNFSRIIFEGFGNYQLAYFRFNLTTLPLVDRVGVLIHSATGIPWVDENPFIYLAVRPGWLDEYEITFAGTVINSLPAPYIDDCRNEAISRCYDRCLIEQFVDSVGAYPREYLVKKFHDDEKLIDTYGEEFQYYNLSLSLYKQCKPICGRQACKRHNYVSKILRPHKRYRYPGIGLGVALYSSKLGSIIIDRKPVISFANFISSFGGLIGLWFGLSIYSLVNCLLDHLTNRLNKLYHNRFAGNQRNQLTNNSPTISKFKRKNLNQVKPKVVAVINNNNILFPKPHYLTRVNQLTLQSRLL